MLKGSQLVWAASHPSCSSEAVWEGAVPLGPLAHAQAWGWRGAAPEQRSPLVA